MASTQLIDSVQLLKNQIAGEVLTPNDPGYEQTRRGWQLSIDQHPALILVPENAQDVVTSVQFAREHNLGIGIQSTGHGVQHPADNQMLIVSSRLASVQIDPETRTARLGAGVLWKQVLDATAQYGLAPLLGTAPNVGIVGYTLGGGIGWLGRRYGLAVDSVRSIDIVTADGVLRHASPTENSELFWGLRGGGGNFGVVTAMEIALYPVATIYGWILMYPAELAGEALRFFRNWTRTAPDEITSSIAIMKFPPVPQLPESMRGKTLIMVRAVYAGNADKGAALIQPWLDWHAPISNSFHEMPFSEIGTVQNDPVDPSGSFGSNEMFDELSDDAITAIVRHATDTASPFIFTEIRHAGGAIARVDASSSAVGNRNATYYLQIGGVVFTSELRAAMEPYLQKYKEALRPYIRGGVYLNFVSGGEANQRIKDAYLPESYERLVALKAKYDPDNLFRFSYQLLAEPANSSGKQAK